MKKLKFLENYSKMNHDKHLMRSWLVDVIFLKSNELNWEENYQRACDVIGKKNIFLLDGTKATSIKNAYDIIETEMTKRDWYYDQEEYEYYISKNGWSTTLPYFCESVDDIGEFDWNAEMLE